MSGGTFWTKIVGILEEIGAIVVTVLGSLFAMALIYYSALYTEITPLDGDVPETLRDQALWNILGLLVVFLIFLLVNRLMEKYCAKKGEYFVKKIEKIFCIGSILLATGIGFWWIAVSHVKPIADSGCVCTVAGLFLQGSYPMQLPTYMGYCPHQYGMVFVLQCMFAVFGIGNYYPWEIMNCLLLPIMLFGGYRILILMKAGRKSRVLYFILALGFLPIYFYLPYVYGDFPAAACGVIVLWTTYEFVKAESGKVRIYSSIGFLSACLLGCTVRRNLLVIIIAAGIVLFFTAIKKGSWKPILLLVMAVVVVFGAQKGIERYYESVSGQQIAPGIPMTCYIMMGLQDTGQGPGWYNGSNYLAMSRFDYDYDAANAFGKQEIAARLQQLWEYKPLMVDFFRRKILSQWNMPDYFSLHETGHFNVEWEELSGIVQKIYDGTWTDQLLWYMDRYQFVLFVGFGLAVVPMMWNTNRMREIRKMTHVSEMDLQERGMEYYLLLIGILGGLFFSILWEAMSRYVFCYVFLMIPLAAIGISQALTLVSGLGKKKRK